MNVAKCCSVVLFSLSWTPAFAQSPQQPITVQDICLKYMPGHPGEIAKFRQEVMLPVGQAQVESGRLLYYSAADAIAPFGTSAKCDSHVFFGYPGPLPESMTNDELASLYKQAHVKMTPDESAAKRAELTAVVSEEYWTQTDGIGAPAKKGDYMRVDLFKVEPNSMQNFIGMQQTYWKALWSDVLKRGDSLRSWGLYQLSMPGGASMPYDAATATILPSLNSDMHIGETWHKLFPNLQDAGLDSVSTNVSIEYYRFTAVTNPKSNSGK